jgi:hypothetical protein
MDTLKRRGWHNMNEILDKEMPTSQKRRRLWPFLLFILAITLLGIAVNKYFYTESHDTLDPILPIATKSSQESPNIEEKKTVKKQVIYNRIVVTKDSNSTHLSPYQVSLGSSTQEIKIFSNSVQEDLAKNNNQTIDFDGHSKMLFTTVDHFATESNTYTQTIDNYKAEINAIIESKDSDNNEQTATRNSGQLNRQIYFIPHLQRKLQEQILLKPSQKNDISEPNKRGMQMFTAISVGQNYSKLDNRNYNLDFGVEKQWTSKWNTYISIGVGSQRFSKSNAVLVFSSKEFSPSLDNILDTISISTKEKIGLWNLRATLGMSYNVNKSISCGVGILSNFFLNKNSEDIIVRYNSVYPENKNNSIINNTTIAPFGFISYEWGKNWSTILQYNHDLKGLIRNPLTSQDQYFFRELNLQLRYSF